MKAEQILIHVLGCGACSFQTSSRDRERTKAMMIDHLMACHQPEPKAEDAA